MKILKKKILAIIPCRSGSKSIKDKNLLKINEINLIQYAIIFAKECGFFDKIIVTTDSSKYKKIAIECGAEVPFLRPKKISTDKSKDIEFVHHCLKFLKKTESYTPDYIVHLRPTTPLRKIKDLKKSLNIINKNKNIDSVKTISEINHSVFKMWFLNHKKLIFPVTNKKTLYSEPYNTSRQSLPKSYVQTALFDIYRVKSISKNLLSGKKIYGFLTDKYIDIDSNSDFINLKTYQKLFKNFKKFIHS
jgi:CMP-N-acetylneuraminic acid synthetase